MNTEHTTDQNIHDWFIAQIPTSLTGGLHADEQSRFTTHAEECRACGDLLAAAQRQDAGLRKMFENAGPSEGFEDRMIQNLRSAGEPRRLFIGPGVHVHPVVRRAAWAAAAAIMLAGFGYEAPRLIEGGAVKRIAQTVQCQSNLRQMGLATFMYSQNTDHTAAVMDQQVQGAATSGTDPGAVENVSIGHLVRSDGSLNKSDSILLPADDKRDLLQLGVVNALPAENSSVASKGGVTYENGGTVSLNGGSSFVNKDIIVNSGTQGGGTLNISAGHALTAPGQITTIKGSYVSSDPNGLFPNGTYTYKDSTAAPQVAQPEFFRVSPDASRVDSIVNMGQMRSGANSYTGGTSIVSGQGALTFSGSAGSTVLSNNNKFTGKSADSEDATKLETQAIYLKFNQAAADAQASINKKDFAAARDAIATAQVAHDENPGILNSDDLRRMDAAIAAQTRDLNNAVHADQEAQTNTQRTAIAVNERTRITTEKESRNASIDALTAMARTDISKNDYQDAQGVLDQIVQLDPQNAYAAGVQQSVQDKVAALASGAPAPSTPAPVAPAVVEASRKIIRHGEMSFEVDSFDSAFAQITKIATEEGGFIATANSDKLANGKVSGVVEVRVPPERLDTFVLKIRALGDLKGQKIASDDITKEYTDLESELRAAKAMEDRLLEIIKTGKGEVKDLVEAEKELGTWREKAEKIAGEINYYNNLISFSTLQINLMERDIRQAALATEQEKVNVGLETDDVEKGRSDALKAIDDAKGRIIQSDLKKFDAGQLAATIVAEVSPANAGPVTDRLKQLGRVARLDITRQQSVPDGATALPGVKVEQKDTQFQISLYNLANIAPRQTTNLSMACDDVESAYHAILTRIADAGGRVVNSSLNRVKPEQIDGTINCESPDDKADAVLLDVRALGQVMHLAVAENPDAANVTAAKRGFAITLVSSTSVAPREVISMSLMPAGNVPDAYHAILSAAQSAGADVRTAQLQEQNTQSSSATVVVDVPRKQQSQIDDAIRQATAGTGRIVSRNSSRSDDTEHTLDTKVQFSLTLTSSEAIAPRDTIGRVLAVSNVPDAYNAVLAAAQSVNSKVVAAQIDQSKNPSVIAELDIIVPRQGLDAVEKAITDAKADLVSKAVNRAADASTSTDEKTSLRLRFVDRDQLPPRQTTTATVQVSDPEKSMADIKASALSAGGHVVGENLSKDDRFVGHLVVDVPLTKASDFIDLARSKGSITSIQQSMDPAMSDATFARARIDFTLAGESDIVGQDSGVWATLKTGLSTSVRGLMYSLQLIIIGLCLVGPWALIAWAGWKWWKRSRRGKAAVSS